MKRILPSWVFLLAAALLLLGSLLTFLRLGEVESRLNQVTSALRQAEDRLNSQIGSIHLEVSRQLEQEASLLAQASPPAAGEFDLSSLSVPVALSFVPKELTDATQASLLYHGETVPCTREGSRFTASLSVPLGQDMIPEDGVILLEDGSGLSRHQTFPDDWWFSSRAQLPAINSIGTSGSLGPYDGDTFSIQMDYEVWADLPEGSSLSDCSCQVLVDGRLEQELPVELETLGDNGTGSRQVRSQFSLSAEIPFQEGQRLDVLFFARDSFGLEHRVFLEHFQDGKPVYDGPQLEIRLPDGSLLLSE